MWEKAKDFLQKAFTIIFTASVIIWFLQTFDTRLNIVTDSSESLLALVGQAISPIFVPLGFGDWRIATSLITGFTAKEAVISTMSVLLNVSQSELASVLPALFTPVTACCFLVFSLLYTPCVAAVGTIRRELGSVIKTIGTVIMQCSVAWLAAFLIKTAAGLFVK